MSANNESSCRVAVIGGTGFVGSYVCEALARASHRVTLLVRPGSENKIPDGLDADTVEGDLGNDEALHRLIDGCDALVYLVGILREDPGKGITFEKMQYEGAARATDIAVAKGVRRVLLMSANGVEAQATPYQRTKYRAERHVENADVEHTIFRPSIVFGDPRGRMEFATQLYRDMVRLPVPAIGFRVGWSPAGERIRMGPVHVGDVAAAFTRALTDRSTIGKTFELCGPAVLTWDEMIETVARAAGKSKLILPMPTSLMRLGATLLDWVPAFPVTRDQLTMLEQSNVCANNRTADLIGRKPAAFSVEHLNYLAREA
jgi:NADH dehydrogenase